MVLDRVKAVGLGEVRAPRDFGLEPIRRVHSEGFVRFLQNAWQDWLATGRSTTCCRSPGRPGACGRAEPDNIDGRLGYYSFDAGAPITAGTWQAITSSANVALSGQSELANGARSVFSLCRPPGHHAAADYMGGYCFNNAAIAAQAFLDRGAGRVAILDVDYHHGNGRTSSTTAPMCCSPRSTAIRASNTLFPRLRRREGQRRRHRLQLQLPTGGRQRLGDLEPGAAGGDPADPGLCGGRPDRFLGVDTFKEDPISQFRLDSPDYLRMGEAIGKLGLATLFVMEGGYAVEEIGINAVNVLQGFEGVHR